MGIGSVTRKSLANLNNCAVFEIFTSYTKNHTYLHWTVLPLVTAM